MENSQLDEIEQLLIKWEQVYKKGLLSFWMLLLLHEQPMYAYEMSVAIEEISQGSISAEENSIYRALKRFENLGVVEGEHRESDSGPNRKYYHLTDSGMTLLARFIKRNILILETPAVKKHIKSILSKKLAISQEE